MAEPTEQKQRINWRVSAAREIILSELEDGILHLDENVVSAETAWVNMYSHLAESKAVPFQQFKERLKDHRMQVQKRYNNSVREKQALLHDRQLHKRQTHNHRGELEFDLTNAKNHLREDVKI